MNKYIGFALLFGLLICPVSCKYSLSGISIPPNVNTFFIDNFAINTSNAPHFINTEFTEQLKNKILSESRLTYTNVDPDVVFSGAITVFPVSSVAPQPNETTAFKRFDISVSVEYINNKKEEENWSQTFSDFSNFEASENLLSVQDQLINEIYVELLERVFRAAFTNW